jgi:hypothetical protein
MQRQNAHHRRPQRSNIQRFSLSRQSLTSVRHGEPSDRERVLCHVDVSLGQLERPNARQRNLGLRQREQIKRDNASFQTGLAERSSILAAQLTVERWLEVGGTADDSGNASTSGLRSAIAVPVPGRAATPGDGGRW